MNKEEIINALVACNNSKGRRCSECPALGKYQHGICKRMVDKETVNLIKCQQEEINRLKVALEEIKEEVENPIDGQVKIIVEE